MFVLGSSMNQYAQGLYSLERLHFFVNSAIIVVSFPYLREKREYPI